MVKESQFLSCLDEFLVSVDSLIFFVESFVVQDHFLGFSDHIEDIWFAIVVSVGTDSEVDLPGVFVGVESNAQTEDWVWGSLGDCPENVGNVTALFEWEMATGQAVFRVLFR